MGQFGQVRATCEEFESMAIWALITVKRFLARSGRIAQENAWSTQQRDIYAGNDRRGNNPADVGA